MWGRRTAPQRLAESAGFTWKHVDDQSELNVAIMTAYVAAHRDAPADVLPMVVRVAEKLSLEEANYDLVLARSPSSAVARVSFGLMWTSWPLRTNSCARVCGPRTAAWATP